MSVLQALTNVPSEHSIAPAENKRVKVSSTHTSVSLLRFLIGFLCVSSLIEKARAATLDLAVFSIEGIAISGVASSTISNTGYSVSSAGDVNGDGKSDMLIGAPYYSSNTGQAYLIYGGNALANINLANLGGAGITITGVAGSFAGSSVSNAGDVNGDGKSDMLIGAPYYSSNTGQAYLIYGGNTLANINLANLGSAGITITGVAGSFTGTSVSSAGDVNDDGKQDILIGAPGYSSNTGQVYLIYGGNALTNINLASLGSSGITITGVAGSFAGNSVSIAGDINGDGNPDILIGAPYYSSYTGQVYLIYGSNALANINLANLGSAGIAVTGVANSNAGTSVSSAADVNGDGIADILIGAPGYSSNAGQAYLIYGGNALANINLGSLSGIGITITGVASSLTGNSVSIAGDVNGDGFADMLIGAPYYSSNTGQAYLIYGGPANTLTNINLDGLGSAGIAITGVANSNIGSSVSNVGDVNGDGKADMLIGASGYSSNIGRAYLLYGSASGFVTASPTVVPTISPTALPSSQPSSQPSRHPSSQPSRKPSTQPSVQPTNRPSTQPISRPTGQPSGQPSSRPSVQPSGRPTNQPSRQPSSRPSVQPSGQPTSRPSEQPSSRPSVQPSGQPTSRPSEQPSSRPSVQPSDRPTNQPSRQPSSRPSVQPSGQPTNRPSGQPSSRPSIQPSGRPTGQPSGQPTGEPSAQPSIQPTNRPSRQPSGRPSAQPSVRPTGQPSRQPTGEPSGQPSSRPTVQPSGEPSGRPSVQPSSRPTVRPSGQPTTRPSVQPSGRPTVRPSGQPTTRPSLQPSGRPTVRPSGQPSGRPSVQPSGRPTVRPTGQPTARPSVQPSGRPTVSPSGQPTARPSIQPSGRPTVRPSGQPSGRPSVQPSGRPTVRPSGQPTAHPSVQPSGRPTVRPSGQPSGRPSVQPSGQPTVKPSGQPSGRPSLQPSGRPTVRPSGQPSGRPSAQPTVKPSRQPTTHPSGQPSGKPSRQPSSQPSRMPTGRPTLPSMPTPDPTTWVAAVTAPGLNVKGVASYITYPLNGFTFVYSGDIPAVISMFDQANGRLKANYYLPCDLTHDVTVIGNQIASVGNYHNYPSINVFDTSTLTFPWVDIYFPENLKWQAITQSNGQLYVGGYDTSRNALLASFNLNTGAILWSYGYKIPGMTLSIMDIQCLPNSAGFNMVGYAFDATSIVLMSVNKNGGLTAANTVMRSDVSALQQQNYAYRSAIDANNAVVIVGDTLDVNSHKNALISYIRSSTSPSIVCSGELVGSKESHFKDVLIQDSAIVLGYAIDDNNRQNALFYNIDSNCNVIRSASIQAPSDLVCYSIVVTATGYDASCSMNKNVMVFSLDGNFNAGVLPSGYSQTNNTQGWLTLRSAPLTITNQAVQTITTIPVSYVSRIRVKNLGVQTFEVTQLLPRNLPTGKPVGAPSFAPSRKPSVNPTTELTSRPFDVPSSFPSRIPTGRPTSKPSASPTNPTSLPSSSVPTITYKPSKLPVARPTVRPTYNPTFWPTKNPSAVPTIAPTVQNTVMPTPTTTVAPSPTPSVMSTTARPSTVRPSTVKPTRKTSSQPSRLVSEQPSVESSSNTPVTNGGDTDVVIGFIWAAIIVGSGLGLGLICYRRYFYMLCLASVGNKVAPEMGLDATENVFDGPYPIVYKDDLEAHLSGSKEKADDGHIMLTDSGACNESKSYYEEAISDKKEVYFTTNTPDSPDLEAQQSETGSESGSESGVESGFESGVESESESGVESESETGVESESETGAESEYASEEADASSTINPESEADYASLVFTETDTYNESKSYDSSQIPSTLSQLSLLRAHKSTKDSSAPASSFENGSDNEYKV